MMKERRGWEMDLRLIFTDSSSDCLLGQNSITNFSIWNFQNLNWRFWSLRKVDISDANKIKKIKQIFVSLWPKSSPYSPISHYFTWLITFPLSLEFLQAFSLLLLPSSLYFVCAHRNLLFMYSVCIFSFFKKICMAPFLCSRFLFPRGQCATVNISVFPSILVQ